MERLGLIGWGLTGDLKMIFGDICSFAEAFRQFAEAFRQFAEAFRQFAELGGRVKERE